MKSVIKQIEKYKPFLEELRKRIYFSAILFVLVLVVGFFVAGPIVRTIVDLFEIEGVLITASSPLQFAELALDVGFILAVVIVFPFFIYQIFSFVSPALTRGEKFKIFLVLPISLFLFIAGFAYGFAILYFTLGLLAELNEGFGIQNIWNVSTFLSQIFMTATLLGIIFQFPLILSALVRVGFFSAELLKKNRRIAAAVSLLLVALLPPTDGVSLIVMVLPLMLLYEVTILVNNNQKYVRTGS